MLSVHILAFKSRCCSRSGNPIAWIGGCWWKQFVEHASRRLHARDDNLLMLMKSPPLSWHALPTAKEGAVISLGVFETRPLKCRVGAKIMLDGDGEPVVDEHGEPQLVGGHFGLLRSTAPTVVVQIDLVDAAQFKLFSGMASVYNKLRSADIGPGEVDELSLLDAIFGGTDPRTEMRLFYAAPDAGKVRNYIQRTRSRYDKESEAGILRQPPREQMRTWRAKHIYTRGFPMCPCSMPPFL